MDVTSFQHGGRADEAFDLVFSGTIDGAEATRLNVARALSAVCGLGVSQIEPLFQNAPLVIRRSLSGEQLKVCQETLVAAGARVLVVRVKNEATAGVPSATVEAPSVAAERLHREGAEFYRVGRLADAESRFREAVAHNPQAMHIRYDLANILSVRGKLEEAAEEYITLINKDPSLQEPMLGLGLVLARARRWEEAGRALRRVLQADPARVDARRKLAEVLAAQGELAQAAQEYRLVADEQPRDPGVWAELGITLFRNGKSDQAISAFRTACEINPNAFEYHQFLGEVFLIGGDYQEATRALEKAIALNPVSTETLCALARCRLRAAENAAPGDRLSLVKNARELFARATEFDRDCTFRYLSRDEIVALSCEPESVGVVQVSPANVPGLEPQRAVAPNAPQQEAELSATLSHAESLLGGPERHLAVTIFQELLSRNPDSLRARCGEIRALLGMFMYAEAESAALRAVELHHHEREPRLLLAESYLRMYRYDDAIRVLRRLLDEVSGTEEGLLALSAIYRKIKRLSDALVVATQAVREHPSSAAARTEQGVVFYAQGSLDEAIACFKSALECDPASSEALNGIGNALLHSDRTPEGSCGVSYFTQALSLKEDSSSRFNRALALLLKGDYAQGFSDYEARLGSVVPLPPFSQPYWDGSDPSGKTILIALEQGHGDRIQMIRFASTLAERGARVLVSCDRSHQRLFTGIAGIEVYGPDDRLPEFSHYLLSMSLPHLLGVTLENLPRTERYLQAPAPRGAAQQVARSARLKVGIVLSGASRHGEISNRSFSLDECTELFELSGVDLYLLQKELSESDRSFFAARGHVRILGPHLADFADTAAVIEQLDMVISIDTSVAHLSGALGKKTWVLLNDCASWQWLTEREDSPWYPSARLFRQRSGESKRGVVARIVHAVKHDFPQVASGIGSAQLRLEFARACLTQRNYPAAEQALGSIRSDDALYVDALLLRAQGARANNDLKKASECVITALLYAPERAEIRVAYAEMLLAAGEATRARELLQMLAKEDLGDEAAVAYSRLLLSCGDSRGAGEVLSRLRDSSAPETVKLRCEYAREINDHAAALRYARDWCQSDPDSADARCVLAELLISAGECAADQKAVVAGLLEEALSRDPWSLRLSVRAIRAFLSAGDLSSAVSLANRVRALHQDAPEFVVVEAECRALQGEPDRAVSSLYRAALLGADLRECVDAVCRIEEQRGAFQASAAAAFVGAISEDEVHAGTESATKRGCR